MKRISVVLAALGTLACAAASAQSYPSKPVRLIVSFVPGGPTDIVARVVAQKISDPLGQPVTVDNRGGAGGIIGADAAAKAAPDGYTLLLGTVSTLAISPSAYATPPYDPMKAFAPVSLLTNAYFTIGANAETMPPTLQAFIARSEEHTSELQSH